MKAGFTELIATTSPALSMLRRLYSAIETGSYDLSSMLETMRQDYIRTERSKGVPEFQVIGKYALKNSILPVVTYVGPMVAALLTGTFIIEKLFSIPGLGRYFVSAISDRDYSVTLGLTIFVGTMIVICNLIVDILYAVIDPRVKITK